MTDEERDAQTNGRIARALASLEVNGVGTLHVSDGQIFFFSRERVQQMLAEMDETHQTSVTVFVKLATESQEGPGN